MSNVTWIVVAGEGRARIFASGNGSSAPQQIDDISNANQSAVLLTDKQAEALSESERKEKERDKFALQVAKYLEDGRLHQQFGNMRIIAEPKFLGMLLSYLDEQTKKLVSSHESKDYSSLSTKEVEEILARGGCQ
ncbi:host attachment protein [Burkholderia sp. D-99]|uniref:host attachment protein n=1 Tax=Burkholderia sp. D-99 TaxID=2717316 RepID=UPI00141F14A8|nr:host attachment protein [Burkholderia sp. D-99]NHV28075.1 host attachment protein [Burkholderia sp. D-99]